MATTASVEQVQRAYVAYYNRPGDPEGVDYWADRLDNGESLNSIIDAFANSVEAESLYSGVATADLITAVYGQAFGRVPDDEGRDYWANRIDSGELSPGEALLTIVEGASGNDLSIISGKVDFSVQVTNSFINNDTYLAIDLAALSSALQGLDGTDVALVTALGNYGISDDASLLGIVGSWRLDNGGNQDEQIAFNFYEDGTYIHWETSLSDVTGQATRETDPDQPTGFTGSEAGTYQYDEETAILTVLDITSNGNGDWGLSDLAGGGTVELVVVGSSFSAPDGDGGVLTFVMG